MFILYMNLEPNFAHSGRRLMLSYESFDEAYDRMCHFMGDHPAAIVPQRRQLVETIDDDQILRSITMESGIFSHKFEHCGTYSIARM